MMDHGFFDGPYCGGIRGKPDLRLLKKAVAYAAKKAKSSRTNPQPAVIIKG